MSESKEGASETASPEREAGEEGMFLVFGGEVRDPQGREFVAAEDLDICGIFPTYRKAYDAWRSASQEHVDNAFVKYLIVRLW
jgi:hypothetical protein